MGPLPDTAAVALVLGGIGGRGFENIPFWCTETTRWVVADFLGKSFGILMPDARLGPAVIQHLDALFHACVDAVCVESILRQE